MKRNNDPVITWTEALDLLGMACAILLLVAVTILVGGV